MHVRPVILPVVIGVAMCTVLSGILYIGPVWTLPECVISWIWPTAWAGTVYNSQAAVAEAILAPASWLPC